MVDKKAKQSNKPSFPEMEEETLLFWEKERIFEQALKQTEGGQPFIFFEGPPTANGKPGLHHVLARAYKDVIPRYKTMRGYYVERKAGWDTHGLPVELQVEKELKISGKPEIEKFGIAAFNAKCKESVWQYKDVWERLTKRIGFWLDLDHPYVTYENEYVESLWWIIKQIWNKDLLYKGYKVVPHCPRCGTALSSHEVALGYQEVTEDSVYIKFKIINQDNTYILSWTTTPWTLPGNVALAVGERIKYVKIKADKEQYILAKEIADKLFNKYKVLEEYVGQDLVGTVYQPLFDIHALRNDASHKVYAADFVNTEEGTGVVHTAVMYGEDDYRLGERVGLPKHHTVDENGYFTNEVGEWAGRFVKDKKVEQDIIRYLEKIERLLRVQPYTHSYPFCWRCDTPLLYYAKDSWFIRMSLMKDKLIRNNRTINWTPNYIKHGRFGEWLNEVKDWAFSRERYWGTPLPIWESSEGERLCIGSRDELRQYAKRPEKITDDFDMHRPFVDDIVLIKNGREYHRVKEVIDVWFDSGAMPYAQWHYPFANKERIDEGISFPADYIAEAVDQTRGWFYTLLAVATLLDKGAPYKNVTCLGLIMDEHGKKMSKSRGNVIDPFSIIDKYGSDPLRWYLYTMNQPGETKLFAEKKLEDIVKKTWLILWNVVSFWKMYSTKDSEPKLLDLHKPQHVLDRWMLARFHVLIREVTKRLEQYEITEATRSINRFIALVSTWYVRRSRHRFKEDGQAKKAAAQTLHYVLYNLAKLMAPFVPFFAETIYQLVRTKHQPVSVHLDIWPAVEPEAIDENLLTNMRLVRQAVELGHSLRKEKQIRVRQPLSQFIVKTKALDRELTELIKAEMNVQEVITKEKIPTGGEFATASGGVIAVALDTTITDELREQGIAREIVRHINAMRKDAQLTVNDKIVVYYEIADEQLMGIVQHYKAVICQGVVAKDFLQGIPDNVDVKTILEIGGAKLSLAIKR